MTSNQTTIQQRILLWNFIKHQTIFLPIYLTVLTSNHDKPIAFSLVRVPADVSLCCLHTHYNLWAEDTWRFKMASEGSSRRRLTPMSRLFPEQMLQETFVVLLIIIFWQMTATVIYSIVFAISKDCLSETRMPDFLLLIINNLLTTVFVICGLHLVRKTAIIHILPLLIIDAMVTVGFSVLGLVLWLQAFVMLYELSSSGSGTGTYDILICILTIAVFPECATFVCAVVILMMLTLNCCRPSIVCKANTDVPVNNNCRSETV